MDAIRTLPVEPRVSEGAFNRARRKSLNIAMRNTPRDERNVIVEAVCDLESKIPDIARTGGYEIVSAIGMFLNEKGITKWEEVGGKWMTKAKEV